MLIQNSGSKAVAYIRILHANKDRKNSSPKWRQVNKMRRNEKKRINASLSCDKNTRKEATDINKDETVKKSHKLWYSCQNALAVPGRTRYNLFGNICCLLNECYILLFFNLSFKFVTLINIKSSMSKQNIQTNTQILNHCQNLSEKTGFCH